MRIKTKCGTAGALTQLDRGLSTVITGCALSLCGRVATCGCNGARAQSVGATLCGGKWRACTRAACGHTATCGRGRCCGRRNSDPRDGVTVTLAIRASWGAGALDAGVLTAGRVKDHTLVSGGVECTQLTDDIGIVMGHCNHGSSKLSAHDILRAVGLNMTSSAAFPAGLRALLLTVTTLLPTVTLRPVSLSAALLAAPLLLISTLRASAAIGIAARSIPTPHT